MRNKIIYDLICLGGGTIGLNSALRAAELGKKVCVVEKDRIGGKHLHSGVLSRYLFHNATSLYDDLREGWQYGINTMKRNQNLNDVKLSWKSLKKRIQIFEREEEIQILNALSAQGIKIVKGSGRFISPKQILVENEIEETILDAHNILISTGGQYITPSIPGFNETITFDNLLTLPKLPKSIIIIGNQTEAVELSSILSHFDTKVTLCCETPYVCPDFDLEIVQAGMKLMGRLGVFLCTDTVLSNIIKLPSNLLKLLVFHNEYKSFTAEKIILAGGHEPCTSNLDLINAELTLNDNKHIIVDEYDATTTKGIYAIGEAVNKPMLYLVAKIAGKLLAERLFGKGKKDKDSYKFKSKYVPSVVHCGSTMVKCGLTEKQARNLFTDITVYRYNGVQNEELLLKKPAPYILKVVCKKDQGKEIVIGMHGIGRNLDEVISGYSIAMNKGLLKEDFRRFMPISKTTAEDIYNAIYIR